jgi:hypothetical protein
MSSTVYEVVGYGKNRYSESQYEYPRMLERCTQMKLWTNWGKIGFINVIDIVREDPFHVCVHAFVIARG